MESFKKENKITIELNKEEALVLLSWLNRFNENEDAENLYQDQAELIGSRYSLSLNSGFETYTLSETAVNFTIGRVNLQTHSGLKNLTGSLNSGAVRGMRVGFTLAGQSGLKALNYYGTGF